MDGQSPSPALTPARRPAMSARTPAIAGLVVVLLAGAASFAVGVSQAAPGSGLYPVKRLLEDVRLALIRDRVDRVGYIADLMARRAAEMAGLIRRESTEYIADLAQEQERLLAAAERTLAQVTLDPDGAAAWRRLQDAAAAAWRNLNAAAAVVPEAARGGLQAIGGRILEGVKAIIDRLGKTL